MTWLEPDYDPENRSQMFEQEKAERRKQMFRVQAAGSARRAVSVNR
jgi:hypothetical protein